MKVLLLALMLLTAASARAEECRTNAALRAHGFVVHSTNAFEKVTAPVLKRFAEEKSQYKFDMETRLYHGELQVPVNMISFDDLRTPESTMLGDIFIMQNLDTDELYEVRWYADGKRQVAYRATKCALGYIPLADNSLF